MSDAELVRAVLHSLQADGTVDRSAVCAAIQYQARRISELETALSELTEQSIKHDLHSSLTNHIAFMDAVERARSALK